MDHLRQLDEATVRFAGLAGEIDGDEPVPACDGWTARDLVVHLGTMHRWAAGIVLSGTRLSAPSPLVTEPLADWYAGTASALVAALEAVSPDEPVPNFTRLDETAAFWPRRQLHETLVHTVDVRQALGHDPSTWDVEPATAGDGVTEVIRSFFPRMTALGRRPDVRSRIRITATDLGRSWVVGPDEDDAEAPPRLLASPDADARISGTASGLYLALWHRLPADRLLVDGADAAALLAGPTTP